MWQEFFFDLLIILIDGWGKFSSSTAADIIFRGHLFTSLKDNIYDTSSLKTRMMQGKVSFLVVMYRYGILLIIRLTNIIIQISADTDNPSDV